VGTSRGDAEEAGQERSRGEMGSETSLLSSSRPVSWLSCS